MSEIDAEQLWKNYTLAAAYLNNGGHGRVICEGALKGELNYKKATDDLSKAGLMNLPKKKYRASIKNYRSSKVH
jgi:hypothetical protein